MPSKFYLVGIPLTNEKKMKEKKKKKPGVVALNPSTRQRQRQADF
jgi:hypothetical protein